MNIARLIMENDMAKELGHVNGNLLLSMEVRPGLYLSELRWFDDVQADLKKAEIKRWRLKALDQNDWAAVMREAKARLKGP